MERGAWTGERLDDLAEAMRSGFARLDTDVRDLRTELREGLAGLRTEMGELRVELRTEIGTVHSEISALKTILLRASIAATLALLGILAALLARGV
jgi:hypothetical protein